MKEESWRWGAATAAGSPPSHWDLPVPAHRCSGRRWPSPPWRSRAGRRGPPPGTRRGYRRGRSRTPRTSPVALKHGQGVHRAPMPPPTPALRCGTRSPDPPGTCTLPRQHPYPCRGWGLCWGMLQGEVTRSNVPRQESPGVPAFGTTASRSGWVPGQVMPCSPSGHEQRLGAMHKPLPQPKEQSAAGSGDRRLLGGQGPPTRSPCPPSPYSRRVHCPLPGDSIHPGQHPLPKPEKQTWGPTRRLRDRREAETTLPRAPRTESKGPGGAPPAGGESSASGTRGEGG